MRSRDPKLMKQIHDYINEFYIAEERTPTTTEIASAFFISRSSAYRYLVYLSENHDIAYEKGEIRTSKMNRINLNGSRAAIVGSIPCGEATSEEECKAPGISVRQRSVLYSPCQRRLYGGCRYT